MPSPLTTSERQLADEELRASETRYRRLFESAKDGILILDAETGRVVDANPFLISLLGYTHADFLGKRVWDLGPFKDKAVSKDAFKELQDKGYVRYEDLPLQTRDGRLINVEFVSNVYWVGETKVIQCNVRDITERKRTEEERKKLEAQLQVSQKMEAIGSLAAGVAHDFNNLLSVILGYTDLALQDLREGDPLKGNLLEVKKASVQAAGLTKQLLAFGRKQLVQPVLLNLTEVAEGVDKMLRRILGEDIDFVQVLAPDLGMVRADPGQIEQVLMNLAINARDAMSAGGKLIIETSNVEIDDADAAHGTVKPGKYVKLVVTDTGCGMDEQTKTQIFDPFFTTKEKGKGTGLGLSTVYGIVKQSCGNISVTSQLGQGTSFKILFPRQLAVTKATSPRLQAIQKPDAGSETILVVDDEEAIRKVVTKSLQVVGYCVLSAGTADEALRIAAQQPNTIHLLLTDVVMPRMGGRALAQELARIRPTVKVLYMSGYADDAFAHDGVVDEKTHFIGKPFSATDLARKVREVLDSVSEDIPEVCEQAASALNLK